MALNIAQMRASLRAATGEDEFDLPDVDADLYLNRSFWEIMYKFPFKEKQKRIEFDTTIGMQLYTIPDPVESVTSIAMVDDFGQHKPLDKIDPDTYENEYNESEDAYGFPTSYTLENCNVRFLPTPDAVYTVVLRRNITLTDLSNTNTTTSIPQVWHEIIVFGAQWRRFFDLGDITRSAQIKHIQNSMISDTEPVEAKEETTNAQYARVEYIGREY